MRAKCRVCAIELSFEAKSETISYYCSLSCYHGGQDKAAGKAAILMSPSLAEAIYQLQICQARYDGVCRGNIFAESDLKADDLHSSYLDTCNAGDKLDDAINCLRDVALSTVLP